MPSRYLEQLLTTFHLREPTLKAAIEALDPPPGSRGLDVGCGGGLLCHLLAEAIMAGLDDKLSGYRYFDQLITNMVDFAVDNPGLYRFIGSDPMNPESIPEEIIEIIAGLKLFYLKVFRTLTRGTLTRARADHAGNTILAYMDGEIFNLINGRYLPDEQIRDRIVGNIHNLFTLLTAKTSDGIVLKKTATSAGEIDFPALEVSNLFEGRTR